MEEALLTLLYGKRERPFCLRGETVTMTLLPAAQLLELRAACAGEGDAFVRALRMGADLVARCLQKDGAPLFENGRAVEVHAAQGEAALKKMIQMDEGASMLGECALVPFRSPINDSRVLFYNTLFDENAACHLALGRGFTNCVRGYEQYTEEQLKAMGINDSMIHVDFMIGNDDLDITGVTDTGARVPVFMNGDWAFEV